MSLELVLLTAIGLVVALFVATAFFGAPYVPTHRSQVRRAFQKLRPLTSSDTVVDLGAGDGRVLSEARRAGAGRVAGVELNPILWLDARLRLGRQVSIRLGSLWRYKLPGGVTVVYMFGVKRDMKKLQTYLQAEANRLATSFELVMYGDALPGVEPVRTLGAHRLYRIEPNR